MDYLETVFACPKCKIPVLPKNGNGVCRKCKRSFKKNDGIWHFLYISKKETRVSLNEYDKMHKKYFGGPTDGSYDILASIARGNKTVDIACGEGIIEQLAPETVGVEFSENALKKAKANGAKHLVLADAHALPFTDNAFDIALSTGNLEHFTDPQKAIDEMSRVAKIQILIVHSFLPIPFASLLHHISTLFLRIVHQPIEKPISEKKLKTMMNKAGLHIVYSGRWTLPFNYGQVISFLPEFKSLPTCSFVISVKK